MVDIIQREGFLRGSRQRLLNADKIPITEWSEWEFSPCSGSGAFSYVYSSADKAGDSWMPEPLEIYDNDYIPFPVKPELLKWQNRPPTAAANNLVESLQKQYSKKCSEWRDNRPLIHYRQTEYRAIPAKIIMDSEDIK